MGSALTIPLAKNKHNINLWGTEYDTRIIEEIRKTGIHPKLKLKLPKIKTFLDNEIDEAILDREFIILAISSIGIKSVIKKIAPYLKKSTILISVTKGLGKINGRVATISEIIYNSLPEKIRKDIPIVIVGGPSIAKEVALNIPTAVVFASNNFSVLNRCKQVFENVNYRIIITKDVIGVEICAALKNLYAIIIGACDGIMKYKGKSMNNTKALLFSYAINEMRKIVVARGGNEETVFGLAGIGDLEVTCKAGRNREFGALLGSGMNINEALDKMQKRGLTIEGYFVTKEAYELAQELEIGKKLNIRKDLPLLNMAYNVLYHNKEIEKEIMLLISKLNNKF